MESQENSLLCKWDSPKQTIRQISKIGNYVHHIYKTYIKYTNIFKIRVHHPCIGSAPVLYVDITAVMQQLLIGFSARIPLSSLASLTRCWQMSKTTSLGLMQYNDLNTRSSGCHVRKTLPEETSGWQERVRCISILGIWKS